MPVNIHRQELATAGLLLQMRAGIQSRRSVRISLDPSREKGCKEVARARSVSGAEDIMLSPTTNYSVPSLGFYSCLKPLEFFKSQMGTTSVDLVEVHSDLLEDEPAGLSCPNLFISFPTRSARHGIP
jgi:hypothetical protein